MAIYNDDCQIGDDGDSLTVVSEIFTKTDRFVAHVSSRDGNYSVAHWSNFAHGVILL